MKQNNKWFTAKFFELSDDEQVEFLDTLMQKANKEKLSLKRQEIGKHQKLKELEEEAKAITDNWGRQLGLASNYGLLNQFCGGFRRKGVYIIGGDPSSGKSTFALNIAVQFDQQGKRVHIVSYEDSNTFVGARIRMMLETLQATDITIPAPELVEGINSMEHNRLYEHLANIKQTKGLDVVLIDYIQFMALFAEEIEYVAINQTMKLFRDIAKQLDIVLIAISQLNRTKDKATSRFHGSSAIEKLADVAVLIDKDKDYPNELFVQVAKSKFTWLRQERIRFEYDKEKKGALLHERGIIQ